ncbi:HAD family hydrolase [Pseudonocardiaceae bacterium YIM PH 21723]|nr:HAD family hydrolase [Pseudonocardiaceae bacterium YIM PH 21723]
MEARVKHIIWDWNGTLLDDNHAVIQAVNAVCAHFKRGTITHAEWQEIYTRPVSVSYSTLLGTELTVADWANVDRLYHQAYRALLHTCGLQRGADSALQGWRNAGGSQSLLSMFFHTELLPLVTQLGIADLFARIDGLREQTGGDTKVEYLRRHLADLGKQPDEVVLIGDITDDAEAAAQLGVDCVLVSVGAMTRRRLQTTGAPVVDSVPEALDLLRAA